jgi:hypothetical protein
MKWVLIALSRLEKGKVRIISVLLRREKAERKTHVKKSFSLIVQFKKPLPLPP